MREILRWIKRGFGARIGWVLAGLLLAALGISESRAGTFAAEQCPAGQSPKFTFSSGFDATAHNSPNCVPGQTVVTDPETCAKTEVTYTGGGGGVDRLTFQNCELISGGQKCNYQYTRHPNSGGSVTLGTQSHRFTRTCEVATCNVPAGESNGFRAPEETLSNACVDNCISDAAVVFTVTPGGGGSGASGFEWVSTGQNCATQQGADKKTDACESSGGVEACATPNKDLASDGKIPNEATPDPDDFTYTGGDADDIELQGCVATESGKAICLSNAPNKPDNGIPGQTAEPDGIVSYQNNYAGNNVYHYYNSSTVNNSTNYGDTNPEGEGEDSEQGECDPATEDCGPGRGAGRIKVPGRSTLSCFDSTKEFYDRVAASEVGQLGSTLAAAIPDTGTCPTASFEALGQTFTLDIHCNLLDQFYTLIRSMFLLFWLIAAALLFLRA